MRLATIAALALAAASCKQSSEPPAPVPGQTHADERTKGAEQVAQPATRGQPGALAGPAAQQDSAAGMSPGPDVVVDGRLVTASAEAVTLDAPNQHGLVLKVSTDTEVKLDGKKATPAQLVEGAEVRAAYRLRDGQKVATRLDGTSNKGKLHPAEQLQKP